MAAARRSWRAPATQSRTRGKLLGVSANAERDASSVKTSAAECMASRTPPRHFVLRSRGRTDDVSRTADTAGLVIPANAKSVRSAGALNVTADAPTDHASVPMTGALHHVTGHSRLRYLSAAVEDRGQSRCGRVDAARRPGGESPKSGRAQKSR